MGNDKRLSVVAIVANVKQFREPFYVSLWERLNEVGIDFRVIYSAPSKAEATKADSIELPKYLSCKVPRLYIRNHILLQMPPVKIITKADLVIVVQSNSYILSLFLVFIGFIGLKKVAFWGHGFNRQGNSEGLSEAFKRKVARLPNWWFAYTSSAKDHILKLGFPISKVTVIQNAIDTSGFQREIENLTEVEIDDFRQRINILRDHKICLYCGSLYPEKKIDFLLEASAKLAERDPQFRLIIVGSGPLQSLAAQASAEKNFVVYLGPLFGRDKAICFKIADIVLNPGLVGLGILDAFAAGLPFVTTASALHSPEIDYLEDGLNGVIVNGDAEKFASVVLTILNDNERSEGLKKGAYKASNTYTLENMVSNVFTGVLKCLEHGKRNIVDG